MPNRLTRAALASAAATALVAVGLTLAPPVQAAPAGGSCTLGCSETHNESSMPVLAGRNWNGQSTGSGQTKWIYTHEKTPQKQDWDAFAVDGGMCFTVRWYYEGVKGDQSIYDRRGKGLLWVQVHNYETAVVTSQGTDHC